MASLYEINQEIMSCIDPETGEVVDMELLDALQLEKEQKIEGVALWIKNLESDIVAYNAEIGAFEMRKKAAVKKVEGLKFWLSRALDGQKFSTGKCAVSFRKSERVDILDPDNVPKKYQVKTVNYRPDKDAIKELLKSGQRIRGCQLIEKLNPQIK